MTEDKIKEELAQLAASGNLRSLPELTHDGRYVTVGGQRMLNLSSNDYLGLAADGVLREEFLAGLTPDKLLMTSSSSRLLTGNFTAYRELETLLATLYGAESALVFNCGYHANTGILPALADSHTLILADKLIHASLVDGLRLSAAHCVRYRHNDYAQLTRLVEQHHGEYDQVIIVVESIYSMDGDITDLRLLADLKQRFPRLWLYVDEAHGVGVRGATGLGLAEEQGCLAAIDFLVGTFGKALASAGAFVVCKQLFRDFLVNRMRPFIFTTAQPPLTIEWTTFVMRRLASLTDRREHLRLTAERVIEAVKTSHGACISESHIVPIVAGESTAAISLANHLQRHGFYVLPVRPPTVPQGTARVRLSLQANMDRDDEERLLKVLEQDR